MWLKLFHNSSHYDAITGTAATVIMKMLVDA